MDNPKVEGLPFLLFLFMTCCWWVRYPVEANFLSGLFSPLTSAEACEKSSRWLWKESCVGAGLRKPRNKYMCVTDRHYMTLAVKVALNQSKHDLNQPFSQSH